MTTTLTWGVGRPANSAAREGCGRWAANLRHFATPSGSDSQLGLISTQTSPVAAKTAKSGRYPSPSVAKPCGSYSHFRSRLSKKIAHLASRWDRKLPPAYSPGSDQRDM